VQQVRDRNHELGRLRRYLKVVTRGRRFAVARFDGADEGNVTRLATH